MTTSYENIDPDGDTLIIVAYSTRTFRSADEPAAVESPGHQDGHSISPSVDGSANCREEPLFDPEALMVVMKIIHAQAQDIPDEITLEMLAAIAEIADDLQCHEALSFCVKVWIARLPQSIPNEMCDDLVRWIFVASVFSLDTKFKQTTRVATMHSTGPMNILGLPMRPDIVDKVEQKRQDILQQLIDHLHYVQKELFSGNYCRLFSCRSMMLGSLNQLMHERNLGSPRPEKPFINMSLSSTFEHVRSFESPSIYLPTQDIFGGSSDLWVLKRDPFSSSSLKKTKRKKNIGYTFDHKDETTPSDDPEQLTAHKCWLQSFLQPTIDRLESTVEGLSLG
ncbi:hypothetical protein F53441_5352 [Fusarium austroafricanum]|uniref:Uncharacterized protein n=1 Tax=Fusarium austroafricanum TaxID=2364996 RepID=A0A8H4KL27_9HYPO|nr:hypothetical protein F53441_5352 [Fusarium austroafricanum]